MINKTIQDIGRTQRKHFFLIAGRQLRQTVRNSCLGRSHLSRYSFRKPDRIGPGKPRHDPAFDTRSSPRRPQTRLHRIRSRSRFASKPEDPGFGLRGPADRSNDGSEIPEGSPRRRREGKEKANEGRGKEEEGKIVFNSFKNQTFRFFKIHFNFQPLKKYF